MSPSPLLPFLVDLNFFFLLESPLFDTATSTVASFSFSESQDFDPSFPTSDLIKLPEFSIGDA